MDTTDIDTSRLVLSSTRLYIPLTIEGSPDTAFHNPIYRNIERQKVNDIVD